MKIRFENILKSLIILPIFLSIFLSLNVIAQNKEKIFMPQTDDLKSFDKMVKNHRKSSSDLKSRDDKRKKSDLKRGQLPKKRSDLKRNKSANVDVKRDGGKNIDKKGTDKKGRAQVKDLVKKDSPGKRKNPNTRLAFKKGNPRQNKLDRIKKVKKGLKKNKRFRRRDKHKNLDGVEGLSPPPTRTTPPPA